MKIMPNTMDRGFFGVSRRISKKAMNNKILTIAIPTYNRIEKLKSYLEKVINQTTDEYVWLIGDDDFLLPVVWSGG